MVVPVQKPWPSPFANSAPQKFKRQLSKNLSVHPCDGNGFVTYNADGTFSYQDDTRVMIWQVGNQQQPVLRNL
jgi:hypothetical protein